MIEGLPEECAEVSQLTSFLHQICQISLNKSKKWASILVENENIDTVILMQKYQAAGTLKSIFDSMSISEVEQKMIVDKLVSPSEFRKKETISKEFVSFPAPTQSFPHTADSHSDYTSLNLWYRVVYQSGAPIREGLELNSRQVGLVKTGQFIKITGQQVNSQKVLRLKLADNRWTSLADLRGVFGRGARRRDRASCSVPAGGGHPRRH